MSLSTASRVVLAAVVSLVPLAAVADTPTRVKGSVSSLTATTLIVKTAAGLQTLTLAPNLRVIGIVTAKLTDITKGSFIGVGSVPDASGGQSALEVHIFPRAMTGTGIGAHPWDTAPQGLMTNATVDTMVNAVRGDTVTLSYPGGSKTITIPPGTPIVRMVPATVADVLPGAAVSVRGTAQASGAILAKAVLVGMNGTVPPM
jgi:hypothetical protein